MKNNQWQKIKEYIFVYKFKNTNFLVQTYPFKIYNANRKKDNWPELSKEEFITKIANDPEYAKQHGELPRIYGEMWRRWPTRTAGRTIDQLKWAINEVIEDPNCHNAIVNSWNPEYLYTMATKGDTSYFPICHNMYQFNIKNEKLSLQLYQRSADIFLGVPFNIGSYALLTHVVARILGREVGEFVHTFGDVHIYEDHFEAVNEQLSREPKAFPNLSINKNVKSLDDFKPESALLEGYEPHPTIKADLTVAGLRSLDNKPSGKEYNKKT